MITTIENIDAERCQCCNTLIRKSESVYDRTSYASVLGGRICADCESQFSRKPIKSEPQSDVEKDYAAFLKGKRNYPMAVRITCADGSEICTPVNERLAKAFLRG